MRALLILLPAFTLACENAHPEYVQRAYATCQQYVDIYMDTGASAAFPALDSINGLGEEAVSVFPDSAVEGRVQIATSFPADDERGATRGHTLWCTTTTEGEEVTVDTLLVYRSGEIFPVAEYP